MFSVSSNCEYWNKPLNIGNSQSDKVAYHSTSVDLKTIVKVFPEEGGKTSVVFSLEYSPIHDALTKKISFGENEAQKYLLGQISTFEKLIASL
jgi:hypothetical protein